MRFPMMEGIANFSATKYMRDSDCNQPALVLWCRYQIEQMLGLLLGNLRSVSAKWRWECHSPKSSHWPKANVAFIYLKVFQFLETGGLHWLGIFRTKHARNEQPDIWTYFLARLSTHYVYASRGKNKRKTFYTLAVAVTNRSLIQLLRLR